MSITLFVKLSRIQSNLIRFLNSDFEKSHKGPLNQQHRITIVLLHHSNDISFDLLLTYYKIFLTF